MEDVQRLFFASHGAEKMFYDLRMGPQMILDQRTLYIVYQANAEAVFADPYIVVYHLDTGEFSPPVQVGLVDRSNFDHHLCPVLWMDAEGYLHVLFNCHGDEGIHRISVKPRDIHDWRDGPPPAKSISYPHIFVRPNGGIVLFARAYGHMGYWYYCVSNDGGYQWSQAVRVIDFDQDPTSDAESWAGTYPSAQLSMDGNTLHIGFTYFDERGIWKFVHPKYKRKPGVNTRYNTYYLKIDLNNRLITNLQGDLLTAPINFRGAEPCMVWNSGDYLTMMPCMLLGNQAEEMSWVTVVTGETEWECTFQFMKFRQGKMVITPITGTNTTWSGCRAYRDGKTLVVLLISGKTDGSLYTYGAGELEKWRSTDDGLTWELEKRFVPSPGDLYNNPIIAESSTNSGVLYSEITAFYGWTGPHSIQPTIDKPTEIPIIHRGKAYLMINDRIVACQTAANH